MFKPGAQGRAGHIILAPNRLPTIDVVQKAHGVGKRKSNGDEQERRDPSGRPAQIVFGPVPTVALVALVPTVLRGNAYPVLLPSRRPQAYT